MARSKRARTTASVRTLEQQEILKNYQISCEVKSFKELLRSVFLLKVLLVLAALIISLVDIGTDVLVATTYYHGLGVKRVCSEGSEAIDKNTTIINTTIPDITNTTTQNTGNNTPGGPREKSWFSLTVIFVFGPPLIRLCMMSTDALVRSYLPCHPTRLLKKRGCMWKMFRWMIKSAIFPIFPVLITFRQFRKIWLMFKIEQREVNVSSSRSFREVLSSVKEKTVSLCRDVWHAFVGKEQLSGCDKQQDEFQGTVCDILEGDKYKESALCKHYEALSDNCLDHFFESFIESGPQTILQISILFQLCRPLELLIGLTILTSFASLALTVVEYEINSLKKNPAKREPAFLGMVLVFCTKAPAIASRCIGLAILFSLDMKGKLLAVAIIASITLTFAVYEYTFMKKDKPMPGSTKMLLHLLTKGHIANFTLFNFRTTYYDFKKIKWKDSSDEKRDSPHSVFIHQIWYYIVMMLVNFLIIVYPYYTLSHDQLPVFLTEFGHSSSVAASVVLGAPLSILFLTISERFKDSPSISKRFGIRAMDGLQLRLKELIESDEPDEFQKLLEKLSEKKLITRLLNMHDVRGQDLFDILLVHSSYSAPLTKFKIIAGYLELCLDNDKQSRLLETQVENILKHGKQFQLDSVMTDYPEHSRRILSFIGDDSNNNRCKKRSHHDKFTIATHMLEIGDYDIMFEVSKRFLNVALENNLSEQLASYNTLMAVKKLRLNVYNNGEHRKSEQERFNSVLSNGSVSVCTKIIVTCAAIGLGLEITPSVLKEVEEHLSQMMEDQDEHNVSSVFKIAMQQLNRTKLGDDFDELAFLRPCIAKIRDADNIAATSQVMKWMRQIGFNDREHLSDLLCCLVRQNRSEEIEELVEQFACLNTELLSDGDGKESRSLFYDAMQVTRCVDSESKDVLHSCLRNRDILPIKYTPLLPTVIYETEEKKQVMFCISLIINRCVRRNLRHGLLYNIYRSPCLRASETKM